MPGPEAGTDGDSGRPRSPRENPGCLLAGMPGRLRFLNRQTLLGPMANRRLHNVAIDGMMKLIQDVNSEILRTLCAPASRYYWSYGFLVPGVVWGGRLLGLSDRDRDGRRPAIRPSVMWGIYLVNFVFWVGIAHSGTLISAILYLFRAKWRTPISRSAEAMTIFAVMIAGTFLLIHLGRTWIFYWTDPLSQSADSLARFPVAPHLRFPGGLHLLHREPPLLVHRARSGPRRRCGTGPGASAGKSTAFSLWAGPGPNRQWHHYGSSYLLLAGLATPLVISVHSVVSWDFALAVIPGYHSTIFAPYFVAGAIHSGLAMVLTLLIPLRSIFRFENIITIRTLEMDRQDHPS